MSGVPDIAASIDALRANGVERIVLTGSSGLLGANAVLEIAGRTGLVGWTAGEPIAHPDVEFAAVDITDSGAVDAAMHAAAPQLVVHLAAATDVDRCQREPAWSEAVNVTGARNVARAAAAVGARLVHVSTDSVYGGDTALHTEAETPAPANVYAADKLRGELSALDAVSDALVARVTMVGFTPTGGRGLLEWALGRLEAGERISGFDDVFFNPVHAPDLVAGLLGLAARGASGVVNLAGSERASKYEFLRALAGAFGYDPDLVAASTVADVAFDAPRPADTSMDVSRAESIGVVLPDLAGCCERIRAAADAGRPQALRALMRGE